MYLIHFNGSFNTSEYLVNINMATVTLHATQSTLNKPVTPHSPNGIAHSQSNITGTDGLRTDVKSERAKFKLDYSAWVASWKTNFLAGNSDGFAEGTAAAAAYDGTFTSVDGSSSVNVDYADE